MEPHKMVNFIKTFCLLLSLTLLLGCDRSSNTASETASPKLLSSPQGMSSSTPLPSIPGSEPSDDAQTCINRVRAQLKLRFGSNLSEMKDIAKLHVLWGETWVQSFDVPLTSTTSKEVASGQIVPQEVSEHINDNVSTAELFAKDKVDFVRGREEFESAYALTLIASSVCMGSGAEIPAFLNRAGSLPPTTGDAAIFRALSDGLLFLERPTTLKVAQLNSWQQLAVAKNPIYRLIAARTFHLVSSDVIQRSEVYRTLLKDSDPTVARIAVSVVSDNVTTETASALNEFMEKQRLVGNLELSEVARKALLRIEKRK